jgi:hypothetical protein
MDHRTVYFSDSFFSTGFTEIYDEQTRKVGELDLQSMFSAGIHVLDNQGRIVYSGKFRLFSNVWLIWDRHGAEIGSLKAKLSLFSKTYAYASRDGQFRLESPAFSKAYTVTTKKGDTAAQFVNTDGMFAPGSFMLTNRSTLPMEEMILVVMGVHAIQKRQRSAAAT